MSELTEEGEEAATQAHEILSSAAERLIKLAFDHLSYDRVETVVGKELDFMREYTLEAIRAIIATTGRNVIRFPTDRRKEEQRSELHVAVERVLTAGVPLDFEAAQILIESSPRSSNDARDCAAAVVPTDLPSPRPSGLDELRVGCYKLSYGRKYVTIEHFSNTGPKYTLEYTDRKLKLSLLETRDFALPVSPWGPHIKCAMHRAHCIKIIKFKRGAVGHKSRPHGR